MIVRAGDDVGIHHIVVDEHGNQIERINQYDTETHEASYFDTQGNSVFLCIPNSRLKCLRHECELGK